MPAAERTSPVNARSRQNARPADRVFNNTDLTDFNGLNGLLIGTRIEQILDFVEIGFTVVG